MFSPGNERWQHRMMRHHHWHHHGGWLGGSAPVRRVRRSLRRKIFFWFMGGMVSTAFVVSCAGWLIARAVDNPWAMNVQRIETWVGAQFAHDFDNAEARQAYLKDTSEQLNADVTMRDASGQVVATVGECINPGFTAPVMRNGVKVASVSICPRSSNGRGWLFGFSALIFVMMMWKVSGRIAARLSQPVDDLTRVVKRIGEGELSARAELGCNDSTEIGLVATAINEMAGEIEKQIADQRELLATVSHELRTPLARIRLISEIARDTGANVKTYDDLDREVREIDALVGQLLASSKVDFGAIHRHSLSAKDIGVRALERAGLEPTLLAFEGTADTISGDATLLQRALANLLDNAGNHGNGVESLRIAVNETRAVFEVGDRGPGVPADASALFESFKRGDGSEGLGLGLALVKRIAEAHGGTVWARNREGGGSVFGFELPVTPPAQATA